MALSVKRPSGERHPNANKLQDIIETGGPKKRLNAEVEAALYKRIKQQSLNEDRSISEITRQLWLEYLSN